MEKELDKEEINAIIQSLQLQRNQALDQLAQASAIISKLQRQISELSKPE
jgi:uncharacterized protein YeeX (DUF496 family)